MTNPLPRWASPNEWREADSDEIQQIEERAGCCGRCFVNFVTGEMVLCDGADLILWSDQSD